MNKNLQISQNQHCINLLGKVKNAIHFYDIEKSFDRKYITLKTDEKVDETLLILEICKPLAVKRFLDKRVRCNLRKDELFNYN